MIEGKGGDGLPMEVFELFDVGQGIDALAKGMPSGEGGGGFLDGVEVELRFEPGDVLRSRGDLVVMVEMVVVGQEEEKKE